MRAKGAWFNGQWTLELGRKLASGQPDDTTLDTSKTYKLGIAAFDQTGDMDKASGVIVLKFAK